MNVLFIGAGKGSWTIRGEQLGAAVGARVTSAPSSADWRWADVAVLVKRAGLTHAAEARAAGVPVVWDMLDCWRQPAENGVSPAHAQAMLLAQLRAVQPVLAIGATQAQADAVGGRYLPHHSRPGLEPAQIRDTCQVVAYEGNAAYLGGWMGLISRACVARGWQFVVNPPDLREADIVVALRDGPWDGWVCREWKSGVKLVNAIAAGRPVITQATAAWREIDPPGSVIETPNELPAVLDFWADAQAREMARRQSAVIAPCYRLDAVAGRYQAWLHAIGAPCSA